jgi:hypothetical protein
MSIVEDCERVAVGSVGFAIVSDLGDCEGVAVGPVGFALLVVSVLEDCEEVVVGPGESALVERLHADSKFESIIIIIGSGEFA